MPQNQNLIVQKMSDRHLECLLDNRRDYFSAEDWREGLESFKSFPYESVEARREDLPSVISAGASALFDRDGDEFLIFANWVIADEISADSRQFESVCYFKAWTFVAQGEPQRALDQFLIDSEKARRCQRLVLGTLVFLLFKNEAPDHSAPVPDHILHFARKLAARRALKRKPPVPLREDNPKRSYSWDEIHKALNKY